jgi:outer membrane protein assembly factor BamB
VLVALVLSRRVDRCLRRCWVMFAGAMLLVLTTSRAGSAGDWPQILGPHRNGTADGETLAAWPASGPKMIWSRLLGQGYAGPAVAGERVVIFHRTGDVDRVEAFDTATGEPLWKTEFPAAYGGGVNSDTGPRCVPLIHGSRVFLFSAAGDLHCVGLADGRKQWSRATYTEFSGLEGYFGAGSTPIVIDNALLVNVGGRDQAGLAGFDPATGKTLWTATDERASYASPIEIRWNDKPHALFVTRLNAIAIEPHTGKVAFQFPFGRTGPTVNAATPLAFNDLLFVTASYGVGARLMRISGEKVAAVWENDTALSSQYNTPIYYEGHLYGIHGREDIGPAELRCVEAASGKVKWSASGFGVAHLIRAGDKLLALTASGQLVLLPASPAGFQRLATADAAQIGERNAGASTRALPALAHGRLYIRDNAGEGGTLRCLLMPAK